MINKTLTGIAVGATLIISGGAVNLVTVARPATSWIQYRVSDYTGYAEVLTATGTLRVVNPIPLFEDSNKDDIISVAISRNKKGDEIYSQITEMQYANLGKKDGYVFNSQYPVIEKITLAEYALEQMIPVAEASIAFDSPSGGISGGVVGSATSLTYSFDNVAGDMAIVSVMTSSNTVTATYNGVSMVQIDTSTTANRSTVFQKYAPGTGSKNIVVSMGSASFIYSTVASWSGTNQSDTTDSKNKCNTTGTSLACATTVVDGNSWTILANSENNGNTPVAGTGSTLRAKTGNDQYIGIFDSNGTVGVGSHSMTWTVPVSQAMSSIIFSIAPPSAPASSVRYIIQPSINWW
jgi:hypothetical protein